MSCAITTDCHWLDREAAVPKCHFRLSRSELPNRPRVGEWENDNETFCPFDCALSFKWLWPLVRLRKPRTIITGTIITGIMAVAAPTGITQSRLPPTATYLPHSHMITCRAAVSGPSKTIGSGGSSLFATC